MNIKIKIPIFLLMLSVSNGYCSDIIIKYIIHKDSTNAKTLVSDYLFNVCKDPWDIFDLTSRRDINCIKNISDSGALTEVVTFKYDINKDGFYFIKDLLGHEVFLDESMRKGDTLTLVLDPIKNSKKNLLYLNDSIVSSWFYKITYPKKYEYMGFFDTLAYHEGDVKSNYQHSYYTLNYDLSQYLKLITQDYQARLKFFKNYLVDTYMPAKLKYFAFKEIQYRYYRDLLDPLMLNLQLVKNYPQNLQDSINKIGYNLNNINLFTSTSWYRVVLLDYVTTRIPGFSVKNRTIIDTSYFNAELKYCKNNLIGETQGYVLAWFMKMISQYNSKDMFSVFYKNYNAKTSNSGITEFVDSLYNIVVLAKTFTPHELLNLNFEDTSHNNHTLKEYFNKDLIIIDCWATWCVPCREQLPYFDSLSENYKNDVQFISISADQFKPKWDKWLRDKQQKFFNIVQLYAQNGFENIFFKRMFITSIPKYILLSKAGQILNPVMPNPETKGEFKKEIDRYLQKK